MLAALSILMGLQFVMAFLGYDIASVRTSYAYQIAQMNRFICIGEWARSLYERAIGFADRHSSLF